MPTTRPKRRVGVIGTFVWDVIYGQPPESDRVEGWGGIAYALSAFDAALPADWEIVPIMKVGADVAERAREFLVSLRRVAPEAELLVVSEPNNRSELRYYSADRRSELLSGGTPGWTWDELRAPVAAANLDALYVNFLSGCELDLETAQALRAHFDGPIYVDLHMLMWEAEPSGMRHLRRLPDAEQWYHCFDLVQVNEDEMAMLEHDPTSLATAEFAAGVLCTVVTLARDGAVYYAAPGFERLTDIPIVRSGATSDGEIHTARVAPEVVREGPRVDPTGCGDVWGATFYSHLLAGHALADAMRFANRAAGRNVEYHGAAGLVAHLSPDHETAAG